MPTAICVSAIDLFRSVGPSPAPFLRAPGERPSQKIIIDIAPLAADPTQALLRYDHPVRERAHVSIVSQQYINVLYFPKLMNDNFTSFVFCASHL